MNIEKSLNDRLIYGKASQSHIVSIECKDDKAILFLETPQGIETKEVPNRYWLLSPKPYYPAKWRKMAGNQFFQYGRQFSSREAFQRARSYYKKNGDVFSVWNEKESFMVLFGHSYYRNLDIKDVSILSFDIETTSLDPNEPNAKVLLISNTYRKGGKVVRQLFAYDDYDSQEEMIKSWCKVVREYNPSILCGHNIFTFDLYYLNEIMKHHGGLKLGRDGSNLHFSNYESLFRKDQTQNISYKKAFIYGREICDTLFLSIKFDIVQKKYDSYGLKHIINREGLEDPNRVFYDAEQIRFKYQDLKEWEKIKEYCKGDSDDALKLFDLMAPPFFYLTRSVPKSFQEIICRATGSQLNSMFVRSYLQEGHSIPKADIGKEFTGAISWGNPGIYSNAIKWDVASLYPSICLQYEIYPKQKDPQKNFLKILEYFTKERLSNKKIAQEQKSKYHKDISEAQKQVCNSAYGMLATNGLNFNNFEQAQLITKHGQEILCKAIKWATGKEYEEWNPEENEEVETED